VLSPRHSRATPRRLRESLESFGLSESDGAGSPVRGSVTDRSEATSGTLVGVSGGGVVGSLGVVGGALTASELAVKVIPIINALKAQLAGVSVSLAAIPVLEAAVAEAKAGQLDLIRKVADLTQKLTETRASVKLLDDWTIAAEFAQLPRVAVGSSVQDLSLSSAPPQGVGSVVMSAAVPLVLASTPVTTSLPELLASDIDRLFD